MLQLRYVIFLPLSLCIIACGQHFAKRTPDEYKSAVTVSKEIYKKDTSQIKLALLNMLFKHFAPYNIEKEFDRNTNIYIDTLVYSTDRLKMIVLTIARNSTDKLEYKENDNKYFYNANHLYCTRDSLNAPIKVYEYAAYNLVNYYNYDEIQTDLRDVCFLQLFSNKDPKEIMYNINDKRFWNSRRWNWITNDTKITTSIY